MKVENKTLKLLIYPSEVCKPQLTKNPGLAQTGNRISSFAPWKTGFMETNISGFIQFLHTATAGFSVAVLCQGRLWEPLVSEFGFGKLHKKGQQNNFHFPLGRTFLALPFPAPFQHLEKTRGETETSAGSGSREKSSCTKPSESKAHWSDLMLIPGTLW